MSRTLHLAEQLIALPSITPEDAGCLDLLAARLAPLGFACERLDSGPADFRVSNLWAKFTSNRPAAPAGQAQTAIKTIVFAGHTDVVPTGPVAQWRSNPFVPTHHGGKLYGRGASDMKTSIAAFVVAVEEFLAATPEPLIALAFLLTSDEEGPSVDGTKVVVEQLHARGDRIDRKEGLAYADSPTNLMWRLQNDFTIAARAAQAQQEANQPSEDDEPSFTEIVLDVKPA